MKSAAGRLKTRLVISPVVIVILGNVLIPVTSDSVNNNADEHDDGTHRNNSI